MRLAKMLKEGVARYVTQHSIAPDLPKGQAGSKHINGKQLPRHYRKLLRTQRKRQRAERRKHRFG